MLSGIQQLMLYNIKSIEISRNYCINGPNFLVKKFCVNPQFSQSFGRIAKNERFHKIAAPGN